MAVAVPGNYDGTILDALGRVTDPELGVGILDLGLVQEIDVHGDEIRIALILTSPACPLGELLRSSIDTAIHEGFPRARLEVEILDRPEWEPGMMSDTARRQLGWRD